MNALPSAKLLAREDHAFWAGRSVFITGAGGFVGAWLAAALKERGARIVTLLRDRKAESAFGALDLGRVVDVVFGDLRDDDLIERILVSYEVQVVFHLAGEALVGAAKKSPISAFDSNVRGTWTLLEACRRVGVESIVVASSDMAHAHPEDLPIGEAFAPKRRSPYETSKACADLIAQSYAHTFGMPVSIARCPNIYGGADFNWSRIVPGTIRAVIKDERPTIRSDGSLVCDYIYVADVVEAYATLASAMVGRPGLAGEVFTFSSDNPASVLDVTNRIIELAGKPELAPDVRGARSPHCETPKQHETSKRTRELLSWRAAVSLDDGLRSSLDWYQAHFRAS